MKSLDMVPAAGPEIDPVCGMHVDPLRAKASWAYQGRIFYFCCPSCLAKLNGIQFALATPVVL
jgi:YHS domain-containing protein